MSVETTEEGVEGGVEDDAEAVEASLGVVEPLWRLVVEPLLLSLEGGLGPPGSCPGEGQEAVAACLELLRRVCAREEEEDAACHTLLELEPPDPPDASTAVRAVCALLFDDECLHALLSSLNDMDDAIAESEGASEEAPRIPSLTALIETLDALQGCFDKAVRKWAIKGLWRLLHAIMRMPDVDSLLPGLEMFESGNCHIATLSLEALYSSPNQATFRSTENQERNQELRPFIVRRAFVHTLLSRMISLEQFGQNSITNNGSFTLGSAGSASGEESKPRQQVAFATGSSAVRESSRLDFNGESLTGDTSTLFESMTSSRRTDLTRDQFNDNVFRRQTELGRGGCRPAMPPALRLHPEFVRQTDLHVLKERYFRNEHEAFSQEERKLELGFSFGGKGLERKSALRQGIANGNAQSNNGIKSEYETPSQRRSSQLRGSELRMSGLRSSRLAQIIMQARRSSMSLIGSVHTYKSQDLAFASREGSALGLENAFVSPRLTDISIPENIAQRWKERLIWSSKSGEPSEFRRGEQHGVGERCGIEYADCATVFELILGRIVQPADRNHFQTINPFLQEVSVAAVDLAPVLLYMLAWMSDNLVRKEFVASLYTLFFANPRNFHLFSRSEGWKTNLLRILQTIPKDRDFRDESSDFILCHIVEIVAASSLPFCPFSGAARAFSLDHTIYEVAVLSGWRNASIEFCKRLLFSFVDFHVRSLRREDVRFVLMLVEQFLLYMPEREDAILGFNNNMRSTIASLKEKSPQDASDYSVEGHTSLEESVDRDEAELEDNEEGEATDVAADDDDPEWLWTSVIEQCTALQMAENQVDFMEFQRLLLRRGVDFGMHLEKEKLLFLDDDLIQHVFDRLEPLCKPNDECAQGILLRLHGIQQMLNDFALATSGLRYDHENKGFSEGGWLLMFDHQLTLLRERASAKDTHGCQCTFCANTRLTDAAALAVLQEAGEEEFPVVGCKQAPYLALAEDLDVVQRVHSTATQFEVGENLLEPFSRCPICKLRISTSEEDASDLSPVPMGGSGRTSPRRNVETPSPRSGSRRGPPVSWNGHLWHTNHFRCYTCARVLRLDDEDDVPHFDKIGGWPYCAECAEQLLLQCPGCAKNDPDLEVFPTHRRWHSHHFGCSRCGDLLITGHALALCGFHALEESSVSCLSCSRIISGEQDFIILEEGLYLHCSFPCFRCCCCQKPLTVETARRTSNESQRNFVFCEDCVEREFRPVCIICMKPILASNSRKVLIPLSPNRFDEDPLDLIEGIRTGDDGRLRCHTECMKCAVCKQELPPEECYLHSAPDSPGYGIFCRVHFSQSFVERSQVGTEAILKNDLDAEEPSVNTKQVSPDAIKVGEFLYIDSEGAPAGPVSGEKLYELALEGMITSNTHVWTPGFNGWTPLAELSKATGSNATPGV